LEFEDPREGGRVEIKAELPEEWEKDPVLRN
jgi:hypothetical protein